MKEIYRNRFGSIIHENGIFIVLFGRNRDHREFRTMREADRFLEEVTYRFHQEMDRERDYQKSPEEIRQERRGDALDKLLTS